MGDRSAATELQEVRHNLRRRRRELDAADRHRAAAAVAGPLRLVVACTGARRIAVTFPTDGEIDALGPLAALATSGAVELAVPVVAPDDADSSHTDPSGMVFARWSPGDAVGPDRYGIPTPERVDPVAVDQLDLVVVPLVGVDHTGRRVGRGRGYYDRALALRLRTRTRPWLLGVCHDFQRVALPPAEAHDVPLDAVLTPAGMWVARHPEPPSGPIVSDDRRPEFPLGAPDR